jgi:molybdopterin-guanine dinucleotide biosynthesis protein A
VPRTPRGLEPLFSYVRPGAVAPAFRAAYERGERAVHRAFQALGPGLVELDTSDPSAWPAGPGRVAGVNTPEDYARVFGRPLVREPGSA